MNCGLNTLLRIACLIAVFESYVSWDLDLCTPRQDSQFDILGIENQYGTEFAVSSIGANIHVSYIANPRNETQN